MEKIHLGYVSKETKKRVKLFQIQNDFANLDEAIKFLLTVQKLVENCEKKDQCPVRKELARIKEEKIKETK